MRYKLISVVAALVVVGSVFAWIRTPQPKEVTETVCTADGREEVRKWVTAVFPQTAAHLRILSCDAGGTVFAGFWHISAEVAPDSFTAVQDFEPLRDPGWIPMQFMADSYVRQFENAGWQ